MYLRTDRNRSNQTYSHNTAIGTAAYFDKPRPGPFHLLMAAEAMHSLSGWTSGSMGVDGIDVSFFLRVILMSAGFILLHTIPR